MSVRSCVSVCCGHYTMLYVTVAALLLSVTVTDVVEGKYIGSRQIPDGITVHKVISTWDEALLQCAREDAVLVSPITTELLNAMKYLIGMNNAPYFIGTKASHYPGPYVSLEGVPMDNMTDAVMGMVQQLDPREGDCLSMDEHSIRVVPCCIRLPFMCYKAPVDRHTTQETIENIEVDKAITERITNTTVTTENTEQITYTTVTTENTEQITNTTMLGADFDKQQKKCGTDGYTYYKSTGSCYKVHQLYKTWDEASAAFEAEHGHLLVIDDDGEAQLIKQMTNTILNHVVYHVGVRDWSKQGDWKSVTGKLLNDIYHNWYDGHPTGSYYCGALRYKDKINNFDCTYVNFQFICQI